MTTFSSRPWHILPFGLAAIVCAVLISGSAQAQSGLGGQWAGSLVAGAETLYVRLNFTEDGNGLSASVLSSLPRQLTAGAARRSETHLELALAAARDTFSLVGTRTADTLAGRITTREATGAFTLLRIAQINPALYDEYAGGYELAPGRLVFLRRGDRPVSRPPFEVERSWFQFLDGTGRMRVLYATSQSDFVAGPAYGIPTPVAVRLTFVRDTVGRVVGLRWRERGGPELYAPRTTRYRTEEIRFASDGLSFSGRLLVPTRSGRHPAVVLLPGGSGPSNRNENYFGVADVLAAAGFATLTFEKRGVGASTGDWRSAGYLDFARDAIAAVQFLRRRRDIEPQCVGLWGISEGGWIAPLAAKLSADIAFVAVVGASGMSHPETDIALLDIALRADSLGETERLRALALERAMIEYARTRRGWNETRARLDTIRAAPWLSHSIIATHTGYDFPTTEDHWFWNLYRTDADYDPAPTLRDVRVPLLAVWGQWDPAAPPDLNVPRFESARAGRGPDKFRLVVMPRGDHIVWEFPTANTSRFHLVRQFVPGYFDLLRTWFSEQAVSCARGGRVGTR